MNLKNSIGRGVPLPQLMRGAEMVGLGGPEVRVETPWVAKGAPVMEEAVQGRVLVHFLRKRRPRIEIKPQEGFLL